LFISHIFLAVYAVCFSPAVDLSFLSGRLFVMQHRIVLTLPVHSTSYAARMLKVVSAPYTESVPLVLLSAPLPVLFVAESFPVRKDLTSVAALAVRVASLSRRFCNRPRSSLVRAYSVTVTLSTVMSTS